MGSKAGCQGEEEEEEGAAESRGQECPVTEGSSHPTFRDGVIGDLNSRRRCCRHCCRRGLSRSKGEPRGKLISVFPAE